VTNANGGGTFSSFTYVLDDVGNRTQVTDNSGVTTFDYDDLYRLTSVTYPGPATDTYTYDPNGNRLTKNADDYTYDAADQLTDLEGIALDYDANGNQLEHGTDTFEYDHENRLVEATVDSVVSTYVYNGDGLRVSQTADSVTTDYSWDVASGLPVILQDGALTYVYGPDLISATDGAGDQVYFSYDGLGSTTDLTDDIGDVVATYEYDVFGAVRASTGSAANVFQFTGEQLDPESGFYFLRARNYDPSTGRFISRDLLEFEQRYAYAMNNPVLLVDPTGKCPPGFCPDFLKGLRDALFDQVRDPYKLANNVQRAGWALCGFTPPHPLAKPVACAVGGVSVGVTEVIIKSEILQDRVESGSITPEEGNRLECENVAGFPWAKGIKLLNNLGFNFCGTSPSNTSGAGTRSAMQGLSLEQANVGSKE